MSRDSAINDRSVQKLNGKPPATLEYRLAVRRFPVSQIAGFVSERGVVKSRVSSTACVLAGVSAMAFTALVNAEESLEEVVVTGSRVISNGDNSPTPVTMVSYADLQTVKPGPIAAGLNQLPIFAGSRFQSANSNPYANGGIVDMDLIPQNLIQRVDMVTGGVSAVCGSDAVTGVINFITNRNFNGVKAHASYGISDPSDGDTLNASIAVGTDLFGGRGRFIGSYEYRDDKGVDRKSSRPWNQDQSAGGPGTAASPFYLVTGARNPNTTFGGRGKSQNECTVGCLCHT